MLNDELKSSGEFIEDAYKALITDIPNGKIPEPLFANYFLEYLSGETPIDKDSPVIHQWVAIAGGETRSVDVINDKQEVLFTVPPLVNTQAIDSNNAEDTNSFSDIFNRYNLLKNHIPVTGEKFLTNALEDKEQHLFNKQLKKDDVVWYGILKHYNKIPTNDVVKEVKKEENDELIYE